MDRRKAHDRPPLGPPPSPALVGHDGQEPGPNMRFVAQLSELSPRRHACLLDRVASFLSVAEHDRSQFEPWFDERADQSVERGLVAVDCRRDQALPRAERDDVHHCQLDASRRRKVPVPEMEGFFLAPHPNPLPPWEKGEIYYCFYNHAHHAHTA